MSRFFIIIFSLLCLNLHGAVNVDFSLVDFVSNPLASKTVTLTPVQSPGGAGQTIVSGDRISWNSGTNGTFTVSNMIAGAYRVDIAGASAATQFFIIVPSTYTSNVPAISILSQPLATSGSQMAYTVTASDRRYRPVAGTNVVIYTNSSGYIVLAATGTIDGGPALSVSNSLWFVISNALVSTTNLVSAATNQTWVSFLNASNLMWLSWSNYSVLAYNGSTNFTYGVSNALYSIIAGTSAAGSYLGATNFTFGVSNALYHYTFLSVSNAGVSWTNNDVLTFQGATNFTFGVSNQVFLASSNLAAALVTNATLSASNLAYIAAVIAAVNTSTNAIIERFGSNMFYYGPGMTIPSMSNNVRSFQVDATHRIRSGIYPCSTYYGSSTEMDVGTFSLRNCTNVVIEGWGPVGSVIFVITNCYGIPASHNPDTNQGGRWLNLSNFKGVTVRNITLLWTNTPHSCTNNTFSCAISLGGTNCSDFLAEDWTTYSNPHQGIGTGHGSMKAYTNINYRRLRCYNSGKTNILLGTIRADGSDCYIYHKTLVEDSWFEDGIRPVEAEISGVGDVPHMGHCTIRGNTFLNTIDSGLVLLNTTLSDVYNIYNNFFITTRPENNGGPYGIWGEGASRAKIYNNHFIGAFTVGCQLSTPSAVTNDSIEYYNNTHVSNSVGTIIKNGTGGSAKFFSVKIAQNTYKRCYNAGMWIGGIYQPRVTDNTFEDCTAANGNIRIFPDSAIEMTNMVLTGNSFSHTNTGTHYGIKMGIAAKGQGWRIRDNFGHGNLTALVLDDYVDITTNLVNIPVGDQLRTNIAADITVSGSYRLNGVLADASMAFTVLQRSNNAWMPKTVARAFTGTGSLIQEIPFQFRIGARDMFWATNITGAGTVTNWSFELR